MRRHRTTSAPPAIEVSEIVTCSNNNSLSLRLPIKLKVRNRIVETEALLDSGAEGVFIDKTLAREQWIQTRPLHHHITAKNVDGTINQGGAITHYANVDLQLSVSRACEEAEKEALDDSKCFVVWRLNR